AVQGTRIQWRERGWGAVWSTAGVGVQCCVGYSGGEGAVWGTLGFSGMSFPPRLSITRTHFPKLAECAHFHYEAVDFGHIQLLLASEQGEGLPSTMRDRELLFIIQVTCKGKTWPVHRSYEEFCSLDGHLHCCIFDRRFSQLPELPPPCPDSAPAPQMLAPVLRQYLEKLSAIVDSNINCGPVLTWMEIDNHGNRLLVNEEASINVPAIAAAHVIKRYAAQAPDELSFEVGDIVSVIDMPPKEEVSWWRGKHGFQVGVGPAGGAPRWALHPHARITGGVPWDSRRHGCAWEMGILCPAVCKKHGKLLGFLRTFMKSRPSKQRLKQRGILRERVFGCDLGEHLLNSGHDGGTPARSARLPPNSRVPSRMPTLHVNPTPQPAAHLPALPQVRGEPGLPACPPTPVFPPVRPPPVLTQPPNPLLTYQLYHKFAEAVAVPGEEERLVRVHDVIQQLPPPHYRTLEFLLRHLARVATHSPETSMHIKNLAIVWAPNLLRSLELEAVGLSGAEAFHEVRVQSVVVEFLLSHVQVLFSDKFTSIGKDSAGRSCLPRPKSLLGSCPSTRLLSLEEAQARTQAQAQAHAQAQAQHTAPGQSKRPEAETGRGPPGRLPLALGGCISARWHYVWLFPSCLLCQGCLRCSLSICPQGLQKLTRLRRPRSSSDAFPALPAALPGTPQDSLKPCRSCESLSSSASGGCSENLAPRHRASLWLDDEGELDSQPDLSPPGSLDLDLLPFQRSPPRRPSLSEASDSASSPAHLPFTCRVARALSPRGPEPPTAALEISEPVAISLPAKVLEMLGGGQAGGVLRSGRHRGTRSPPHMISRLLQTGDGMLTDSCQREVQRKLTRAESGSLAQSPESEASPPRPGALCLFRHVPPPPPPKNPARLMALALAESAHRAAQQQQGGPHSKQQAQFRRSLSLEGGGEGAAMGPGTLYSVVCPGPAAQLPGPSLQRQQSEGEPRSQRQERGGGPQVSGGSGGGGRIAGGGVGREGVSHIGQGLCPGSGGGQGQLGSPSPLQQSPSQHPPLGPRTPPALPDPAAALPPSAGPCPPTPTGPIQAPSPPTLPPPTCNLSQHHPPMAGPPLCCPSRATAAPAPPLPSSPPPRYCHPSPAPAAGARSREPVLRDRPRAASVPALASGPPTPSAAQARPLGPNTTPLGHLRGWARPLQATRASLRQRPLCWSCGRARGRGAPPRQGQPLLVLHLVLPSTGRRAPAQPL
uniref:Rho GTPase activating protein 33 n=1 Tax=Gopherus evgoodei TaxID=1825980 RepID=A0A8C4Y827_9SAUR